MLDERSELSPAAQAEMNRVDKDKNGVLDPAEQRQVLRNAAELRSDIGPGCERGAGACGAEAQRRAACRGPEDSRRERGGANGRSASG